MYEALTRSHDPAILIAPDISSAITRIQEVEAKKERRRDGQIEGARVRREEKEQKRKREEEEAGEDGEPAAKRVDMKVEEREDTPMLDGEANPSTSTTAPSAAATPQPLAPSTLPSTSAVRPPNPNHHTPKSLQLQSRSPISRPHELPHFRHSPPRRLPLVRREQNRRGGRRRAATERGQRHHEVVGNGSSGGGGRLSDQSRGAGGHLADGRSTRWEQLRISQQAMYQKPLPPLLPRNHSGAPATTPNCRILPNRPSRGAERASHLPASKAQLEEPASTQLSPLAS